MFARLVDRVAEAGCKPINRVSVCLCLSVFCVYVCVRVRDSQGEPTKSTPTGEAAPDQYWWAWTDDAKFTKLPVKPDSLHQLAGQIHLTNW